MNVQGMIKRTALSALMFSAIAAPVVANADSSPGTKTPVAKLQAATAVSVPVDGNNNIQNIQLSQVADPLRLVKKYAPETVGDWQKTLAKFQESFPLEMAKDIQEGTLSLSVPSIRVDSGEKTNRYELSVSSSEVKAVPAELSQGAAFIKDDSNTKAGSYKFSVPLTDTIEWKETNNNLKTAVTATIAGTTAAKADTALAKAWTALSKADESQDAGAIKQALAVLLQQYKQEIADHATNG